MVSRLLDAKPIPKKRFTKCQKLSIKYIKIFFCIRIKILKYKFIKICANQRMTFIKGQNECIYISKASYSILLLVGDINSCTWTTDTTH